MLGRRVSIGLRLTTILLWVGLFAALLQRDYLVRTLQVREAEVLQRDREESYVGVYFKNERIGYVFTRVVPADGDEVRLEQESLIHLNILNAVHPVRMTGQATLTAGSRLKAFTVSLTSTFYQMQAHGSVDGQGNVHYTLTTGKETIADVVHLPGRPYFYSDQRRFLLSQGLKEGDKIKLPHFDPITLTGSDTVLEYRGRDKVLIEGRVHNLHHFIEVVSGVRINTWLNDQGRVVKEESPAGFVFLAEPEFKAKDIVSQGKEVLASVSAPLDGPPPDLANLASVTYHLDLPEDVAFSLDGGRQFLTGATLTLHRESLPGDDAPVCPGEEALLAPSATVQANNPQVVQAAREATVGATSPIGQVRAITEWLYRTIDKRPVIGIPDAVTTLATRVGDCNEHAVLFAALGRSLGIPTKIASGVMLHQGAFYYHAWNEVCLGGQWLSVDTTRNQLPADLSHIRFVEGGLEEQVKIGALLGRLRIRVER